MKHLVTVKSGLINMARAWDKNKKGVVPDGPMEPMPSRTTEILNPADLKSETLNTKRLLNPENFVV